MVQSDEQQQPPWPYRPGVQLAIQAHTPPPPFSQCYRNEYTIRSPVRDLPADDQIDRLDFTLSNPPLETPQPAQAKSHALTILEKIDRLKSLGVQPSIRRSASGQLLPRLRRVPPLVTWPRSTTVSLYLADRDYPLHCRHIVYLGHPPLTLAP